MSCTTIHKCFCKKPSLITTSKENEIICKNCGVTFGYDENYNVIHTVPSYHITKSKTNLFQRKQNGSNPYDTKKLIQYKKLHVEKNSDLGNFSTICDKLGLSSSISEQCYLLFQKISKQYSRFTRAKSICLSIYLVCRKNTIPYDEQNVRDIVCQTLGVKNAPKFKSVIFKINKNSLDIGSEYTESGTNNDEISKFYSTTDCKSKERFYLNLHISDAQKRLKINDISVLKRLSIQYYEELSQSRRFYANDNLTNMKNIDYDTKAKNAVSLALQRCIIS